MTEKNQNGKEKIKHVEGPWINLKSKSHLGRVYYFNTVTGEAVWNLAEVETSQKASSGSQSQDSQSIASDDNFEIISPNYVEETIYDTNPTVNKLKPTMMNKDLHSTANYNISQTSTNHIYNPNIWDVPPPILQVPQESLNKPFQNVANSNDILFNNFNSQNNINASKLLGQSLNINNFTNNKPFLMGNMPHQQLFNTNSICNNAIMNSNNLINQSSNFCSNQQLGLPDQFAFNVNNLSGQPMTNINFPNEMFTNTNSVINQISNTVYDEQQQVKSNIFNPNIKNMQSAQIIKPNIVDNDINEGHINSRNRCDLLSNRFKLMSDGRNDSIPRVVKPYRRKSISIEINKMPAIPNKKTILNPNDLRFKLTARKNLEAIEQSNSDCDNVLSEECNNLTINNHNRIESLENKSSDSDSSHDKDEEDVHLPKLDVSPLKRLAKPAVRSDRWYIVADTNVLMSNLFFVNILIKSDPCCRMMVPYQVHSELDSYANRSASKKNTYNMARRASHYLARELKTKVSVIGQTALKAIDIKINRSCGDDDIINCCLQLIEQDYHVILLTNDIILNTKAEASNIVSFSIKQIKDYLYSRQEGKSKYKITIQNKKSMNSEANEWCFEKFLSQCFDENQDKSNKDTENLVCNKLRNNQIESYNTNTQIKNNDLKGVVKIIDNKVETTNDKIEHYNDKKLILSKTICEQTENSHEIKKKITLKQLSKDKEKSKMHLTVINPSLVSSKPIKLKRIPTKLINNNATMVDNDVPKFRWRRKSEANDKAASITNNNKTINFDKNKEDIIIKTKIDLKPNCKDSCVISSKKSNYNNEVNCSIPLTSIGKSCINVASKPLVAKQSDESLKTDVNKNLDVAITSANAISNIAEPTYLKPNLRQNKVTISINNDKNKLKRVDTKSKKVNIPNKQYLEKLQISVNLFKSQKQVLIMNNNNKVGDKDDFVENVKTTISSPIKETFEPYKEIINGIVEKDNYLSDEFKADINKTVCEPSFVEGNNLHDDPSHKYSDIFDIKDEILGERLRSRSDEWIFRFSQIMEEILSQLLQQNFSEILRTTMPPPWTVHEATECIKHVLSHKPKVVNAATKLSISIFKNSDESTGNFITNVEPREYMKLYNQGVGLIKSLKEVYPNNEDIVIAETLLSKLIIDIRDVNNSNFKYIEASSMENFMEVSSIASPFKKTIEPKRSEDISSKPDFTINKVIEGNNVDTTDGPVEKNDSIDSSNKFKFIRTCNVDPSTFMKLNFNNIPQDNVINVTDKPVHDDEVEEFIQKFLNEVRTTLLDVHNFCKNTTMQLEEEITIDKSELKCKVESVKHDTENILEYLKRILNRETHGSEVTLSSLLPNSMLPGHGIASKYREIIKRCTVQADILLDTLNAIIKTL